MLHIAQCIYVIVLFILVLFVVECERNSSLPLATIVSV